MQLLGERYKLPSLPSLVNYVDNVDGGRGNLNSVTLNVSFLLGQVLRQGLM